MALYGISYLTLSKKLWADVFDILIYVYVSDIPVQNSIIMKTNWNDSGNLHEKLDAEKLHSHQLLDQEVSMEWQHLPQSVVDPVDEAEADDVECPEAMSAIGPGMRREVLTSRGSPVSRAIWLARLRSAILVRYLRIDVSLRLVRYVKGSLLVLMPLPILLGCQHAAQFSQSSHRMLTQAQYVQ